MKLIDRVRGNVVNYDDIAVMVRSFKEPYDIGIIIGVRGRNKFVKPFFNYINRAIRNKNVFVTIVEHSNKQEHYDIPSDYDCNYIWVRAENGEPYNRSLSFNIGVVHSPKSDWIVTHDIDCLVQKGFFDKLMENADYYDTGALQSFTKRRVLYCDERLTNDIIRGYADINRMGEKSVGVSTYPGKAPGGSMCVSRDLFLAVGGYDPELFTGYAPEDQMFWEKLSLLSKVESCDNPPVEIFHMNHEFMGSSNPRLKEMVGYMDEFSKMTRAQKMKFVNEKSKILSQWL